MEKDAIDYAMQAMNDYNLEKEMAAFVKREFDKKYSCAQPITRAQRAFSLRASCGVCCSAYFSSACARGRPTWHVVVGTNYGSHVVHQTKNFIYFYLGPKAFLIFKSG